MGQLKLSRATAAELDQAVLYGMLALRVEVFVVEQGCAYQELDGLDLEPSTVHFWFAPVEAPHRVHGYLRLLANGRQMRIGRVCVARADRGAGLASKLMRAALLEVGIRPCVLSAQVHMSGWYAGFGFERAGEPYDDDGIDHVPMRRAGLVNFGTGSG
jgi:ElaA protein